MASECLTTRAQDVAHVDRVHTFEVPAYVNVGAIVNFLMPVVMHVHDGIFLQGLRRCVRIVLVLNPDFLHDTARALLVEKQLSQHHLGLTGVQPPCQAIKLVSICDLSRGAASSRSLCLSTAGMSNIVQHLQHLLNAAPPMHKHIARAHLLAFILRAGSRRVECPVRHQAWHRDARSVMQQRSDRAGGVKQDFDPAPRPRCVREGSARWAARARSAGKTTDDSADRVLWCIMVQ